MSITRGALKEMVRKDFMGHAIPKWVISSLGKIEDIFGEYEYRILYNKADSDLRAAIIVDHEEIGTQAFEIIPNETALYKILAQGYIRVAMEKMMYLTSKKDIETLQNMLECGKREIISKSDYLKRVYSEVGADTVTYTSENMDTVKKELKNFMVDYIHEDKKVLEAVLGERTLGELVVNSPSTIIHTEGLIIRKFVSSKLELELELDKSKLVNNIDYSVIVKDKLTNL